jgi:hypothetical protein
MESLETDKLINSCASETNPELRKKKNLELGQYYYDNYFGCPIALKATLWGASNKIAGWSLNNLNSYLHNLEYVQKKK